MRFAQFAEHLESIEEQTSRQSKIEQLSELLGQLGTSELAPAIYLCQGRLADPYCPRQTDHIRLGQRYIIALLGGAGQRSEAESSLANNSTHTDTFSDDPLFSLSSFHQLLHASISHLDTWLSRRQPVPPWLAKLSQQMSGRELRWLVKVMIGPLFSDEFIISALTDMAATGLGTQEAIEKAYKYTVLDLGIVATTLVEHGYWAVETITPRPGIPLRPEILINYRDDIESAWESIGPCYVQPKYDGWYLQIHKCNDRITLFDRKLEDLTARLPDAVQVCRQHISSQSAIFDSELVGYDPETNRILPYGQTLTSEHHKIFVYDVIVADGKDWRNEPYYKRREFIVDIVGADNSQSISAAYEESASTVDDLRRFWNMWKVHEDFEGLIVRKPTGEYRSGRESRAKGKVTARVWLDVVVLGYTVSQKGSLSVLVGVWDGKKDKLIPIATVEGAIIQKEVQRELWRRCQDLRIGTKPSQVVPDVAPRQWVQPRIVVAVETKGRRTKSRKYRHAGYTIQRKTAVRIRDDKSPEDANDMRQFMSFPLAPGEGE